MSLQSKKNGQLRFVSDMGTSNGSLNKNIIKTPVINLKKGKFKSNIPEGWADHQQLSM